MRGSIRQRRGGWELRVYLGRDPVSGKPRYRSQVFRGPRRQAEDALARMVTEVRDGRHPAAAGGETFGELLDQWFAAWSPEWSPGTAVQTRRMIDTKLAGLQRMRVDRLTPASLYAFYGALRDRGGVAGRPLAQTTVRRIHAVVSAALEQAVRWGWLSSNPAQRAWKGKGKGRGQPATKSVPTPAEVALLLDTAGQVGELDLLAVLELEVHTGLRRGELLALRWTDFDPEQATLGVSSTVVDSSSGLVDKAGTQTGGSRSVVLSTEAVNLLAQYRSHCVERAAASGAVLSANAYLFSPSDDGTRPWWPSSISRKVHRLCERAGLRVIGLQELRRFHSSLLITGGIDVATETERLGHGATVALRDYVRSNRQAHERAARVVADALVGHRSASL
jgi:integrase